MPRAMPFPRPPGFLLGATYLLALSVALPACHGPVRSRAARPAVDSGIVPPPADETKAARGTHIVLIHAANLEGEYEVCGCPSHPLGGLTRRATVIDLARAEADGVLVVDAGDLILPGQFRPEPLVSPPPVEVERRADLLLAAYARMGLDAFLPAERDLAVGPAKLKQWLKSHGIPAVASNLVGRDGRPFFDRDRIVTVAGVPVGIFGLVAAQPEDAGLWRGWPVHTTSPEQAAREEVASLRARGARMIVALLHLGPAGAAHDLLQAVPGIDWAVQGHVGMQLDPPSVVGGAHLVDTLTTGKFAGRLDIHLVGGAAPGHGSPPDAAVAWTDRGQRKQLLGIIADHRRQLADLARRAASDRGGQLQDFYRQRREAIERALAGELVAVEKLPVAIDGSWYEGQIIPLDEAIPDQSGVAMLTAAYNVESARRATAGLPVGVALRDPAAPRPAGGPDAARPGDAGQVKPTRYAGTSLCSSCHPKEAAFFATTKHAGALATLANLPRSKGGPRDHDPACVGCHSTGFMLPGGTWSIEVASTRLRDVGCESCHGPSLGHISLADKKQTTHRDVPETVCRGCHTPDRTNGEFEYGAFKKAILGPGHGGA
jgi:Cytochrome c554 and c-prime